MPGLGDGGIPSLRFIERLEGTMVFLELTALFLEDDKVSETFSVTEALRRLRVPQCEIGDRVFYRTRSAVITQCHKNDLHVHLAFDAGGPEHYTNIIHVDFAPTLIEFA
jgi:hypothetical protein